MKLYFIHARTGCTCCSEENHYRGPYKEKADAKRRMDFYYNGEIENGYCPLASQFARRGSYSISDYEAEEITNHRWVIGDKVFDIKDYIEVDQDGRVSNNELEHFTKEFY